MDDIVVVNISSSRILDDESVQLFGHLLYNLVDQASHRILLNFAKVEILANAALGKLIIFRKKLETAKGKLALSNIRSTVFEEIKLTGVDRLFKIFDEEHEAYEYLKKQ